MMKLILGVLLILAISQTSQGRPSVSDGPCNEAADILFLVDTSSSIWPGFYQNVKTFLKDVIKSFNIGPDVPSSRVGLLTFSTREYLEFHLNKYQTVEALLKAIDNFRFRGGDTYTHRALEFVSKEMLTPKRGAREGVAKLVVVLTDGKSANAKKTAEAAAIIKAMGADIFAVGVGNGVDFLELNNMASSPSQQFVFQVTDFRALDSIKNVFAQTTCEVLTSTHSPSPSPSTTTTMPTTTSTTTSTTSTTTPTTTATTTTTTAPTTTATTTTTTAPTTTATTTTTAPTTTTSTAAPIKRITTRKPKKTSELPVKDAPKFDERCKGKPADIYFLLDASTSVWIGHFHDRVLPFVRDLVSSFEISPLLTRVGLVTFSNNVNHEFGLSDHQNLKSLLAAIQPEHVDYLTGGTNTGDAIEYVTNKGFGAGEARKGVAQIIITVTDGLSQIPKRTAEAAAEARSKGLYMFAVGVGTEVDEKELSYISSDPDEDFVFSVDDFKALSSVTELLAQKTCKAVSKDDSNIPNQITQCSHMTSNVMFVYDYLNSISVSKVIVQELISDFINDAIMAALRIKVGLLTQPCVGGVTSLQSIHEFQVSLATIRSNYNFGYPDLVRQLRTETFGSVPLTEQRIAVLIVDEMTSNLDLLQKEVMRLKFTNVKVIVVAVGKVEEVVLEQLASTPIRDHVIRVDSYNSMRDTKVDILGVLCEKRLFGTFENGNQGEYYTSSNGLPSSSTIGPATDSRVGVNTISVHVSENEESTHVKENYDKQTQSNSATGFTTEENVSINEAKTGNVAKSELSTPSLYTFIYIPN